MIYDQNTKKLARALRQEGLEYPTIHDRLGVSITTLERWLPDLSPHNPKTPAIDDLLAAIEEGLDQRAIGHRFGASQSTVRRWLSEQGLKTDRCRSLDELIGQCRLCGHDLVSKRRRRCGSCNTKVRRIRTKRKAVALLGGKCVDCGWSGPLVGYDFHHLDPAEKDFNIGAVSNKSWQVILTELEKCVLLCALCHRLRHDSRDPLWIAEEDLYQKRSLRPSATVAELVQAPG